MTTSTATIIAFPAAAASAPSEATAASTEGTDTAPLGGHPERVVGRRTGREARRARRVGRSDSFEGTPAPASEGPSGDFVVRMPPESARAGRQLSPEELEALLPPVSEEARTFTRIVSGEIAASEAHGYCHPLDDPAVAVGAALHFARRVIPRRLPMPPLALQALRDHAGRGDPACALVLVWIERKGVRLGRRTHYVIEGGRS